MLARMVQHEVTFDHLNNSTSKLHRTFLPYTQNTFKILSKIVSELVSESGENSEMIPLENFPIINKILSLELVTSNVFKSSDEAIQVLGRFLDQQLSQMVNS